MATVRISAFCVAMLSNNSFICKYNIFFRKYELLAELMKYIHSNYSFDSTQAINIQRMDGYSPVIFYDFGDYVQTLCGTDTEIYNNFKTLLEKVIPYKTHTKEFYTASRGPITVERYSGITTSEPSTNSKMVDYPKTSWCIDTH